MVKPAERLNLLNSQSMILPEKCWTDLNCIWHYQRLKKIKNTGLGQHHRGGKKNLHFQTKVNVWEVNTYDVNNVKWQAMKTRGELHSSLNSTPDGDERSRSSFTPGGKTRDTLNMMLGGPQSWFVGFGKKNSLFCRETNQDSGAVRSVG